MLIIASAEYVDGEFRAEVGDLPPVMLPVGNKRLFNAQYNVLKDKIPDDDIFMSLPEGYELPEKDKRKILEYNISIVYVPTGLSLADSILYVINSIGEYDSGIKLLHGDTLIYDLPLGNDVLAISRTNNDYRWEVENIGLSEEIVWSGYFAFSDSKRLVKSLATSKGSFVNAVRMYNDNNQVNVTEVFEWLDFGHINNYFRSRSKNFTQRHFNSMVVDGGKVIKSSSDLMKISAERMWFDSIPPAIKFYTPHVVGSGQFDSGESYYELEYLSCMPLNELFVHARNPTFFWSKIFQHLEDFLSNCESSGKELIKVEDFDGIKDSANLLVIDKTKKRIIEYIENNKIDFDLPTKLNGIKLPSLNYILDDCMSKIDKSAHLLGVLHGDLCFSNVLYDTRSDKIKVIDPRGIDFKGNFTCIGDLRYDLSKINHSVIGLYDYIVSGAYDCVQYNNSEFEFEIFIDERIVEIQKVYVNNMRLSHIKPLDLMPETILLFLSMLPLHVDDSSRQDAFIANILRLYSEYMSD